MREGVNLDGVQTGEPTGLDCFQLETWRLGTSNETEPSVEGWEMLWYTHTHTHTHTFSNLYITGAFRKSDKHLRPFHAFKFSKG